MSQSIPLGAEPGTRYGQLIVMSVSRSGRNPRVLCRCDCSSVKDFSLNNLRSGRTRSCGLCGLNPVSAPPSGSERAVQRVTPKGAESGVRYGRLTVLSVTRWGPNPRVRCRCDCRVEREFSLSNLRSGRTRSCGCLLTEKTGKRGPSLKGGDAGRRYGRLTVIRAIPAPTSAYPKVLCRCDCSAKTVVFLNNLRSGNTTSCGRCNERG